MEITYPLVVDTLGKMRMMGSRLSVNCATCNKHTMLDMDDLIERLGEDHGCMATDLKPLFYCVDCRREGRPDRNITFIDHGKPAPNAYAKSKGR